MRKIGLAFIMLVVAQLPAFCEVTEIVAEGFPMEMVTSEPNATNRNELTRDEMEKYKLMITKKGSKYYWNSRQNRELELHKSGIYYTFLEPNGAGYIKIQPGEEGAIYMEHMNLHLGTYTYWGIIKEFKEPQ